MQKKKQKKIEKLFSKLINTSREDVNKLKRNEMIKMRRFQIHLVELANCLISHILEPIKKALGGVRDQRL